MSQEKVTKLLARKGDCLHETEVVLLTLPDGSYERCKKCHTEHLGMPDLTTEAGAFWIMVRLPEWARFDEFCHFIEQHYNIDWDASVYVIKDMLTWLALEAENGKAPALYKALCEFMGWEVEG